MKTVLQRSLLYFICSVLAISVTAQPGKDPYGWSTSVGAGAIWGPAFSGSSDYQLMLVPNIQVNYGKTFFASVGSGIGYNFEVSPEWVAGPLVKFDFGRDADGESTFRVAGSKSNALRGFQDVDSTILVGGFARFNRDAWATKIELLQGVNGHEGMVAEISIDYKIRVGGSEAQPGPPLFIATGPRLRWASEDYTNTYYGITLADSLATGLPVYAAEGGIETVGWGLSVVMPFSRKVSLIGFAGYDRLMGDAADSPLVVRRGSENQFRTGAFMSYKF